MSVRNAVMRERITAAAARIFQTRGINGVSMQEVAAEVGLSKAALYHYYDNRDDLLRHIFGDWARQELEKFRAIAESDADPEVKMFRFIETHLTGITQNLDLYSLSFREESELPEDVRAEFRGLKRETDVLVRGLINEGVERGVFEPVDQRLAVFAIVGMCNWLWKWYRPKTGQSPEEIAEVFSNLVLRGLMADTRGMGSNGGVAPSSPASTVAYHARALRHHSRKLEEALAEALEGSVD